MKRIATIGAVCFAVALSGAAVALASSGSGREHPEDSTTNTTGTTTNPSSTRSRSFDGRVTAVDATTKTFDLKIRRPHRRRVTVTIAVTDTTVFKNLTNGFASIEAKDRIKAKARRVNGVWVASRVQQKRAHHEAGDDNGVHASNHDANDDNGVDGANHDVNDDHGGNSGHGGGHDD